MTDLAHTEPAPPRGPADPVGGTPSRRPGSVRRTTTLDMARPQGLFGPVVADVRGRDLATDATGTGRVVDEVGARIEIDQRSGCVTSVAVERGEVPDLVGVSVRSGFGRALAQLLAEEAVSRSLRYSLLDDLGGALLVSGYTLLREGGLDRSPEVAAAAAEAQADICVGWARDGELIAQLRDTGLSPIPLGPAAPVLEDPLDGGAVDPLAWHPTAPMAAGTVRRRRRLDVVLAPDGRHRVESHLRDSYLGPDGEMVMHEYLLAAALDHDRRLVEVEVGTQVLPWAVCPGAAASATGVLGLGVDELPARVRAALVGPSTCTHLNSTLRGLADVTALEAHGAAAPG